MVLGTSQNPRHSVSTSTSRSVPGSTFQSGSSAAVTTRESCPSPMARTTVRPKARGTPADRKVCQYRSPSRRRSHCPQHWNPIGFQHPDDAPARPDQLRRHGDLQRARAGHEDPAARQDALPADQRLRRARRDDAGKRPPGKRHRPLVRPGGEDQLRGGEDLGPPLREDRHASVGEGPPDQRLGEESHAGLLRLSEAPSTLRGVLQHGGVLVDRQPGCRLPEVLSPRPRVLVQDPAPTTTTSGAFTAVPPLSRKVLGSGSSFLGGRG